MQLINYKQNFFTVSVSFVSMLLFVGGTFPYGFPLFAPAVFLLFLLFLFAKNNIFFAKCNLFYLLLFISYLLPLGIFGTFYPKNILDMINGLVVFIFFIVFQSIIQNRNQFKQYTKYIQNTIFLSSFIIAVLGLVKLFLLLQGNKLSIIYRSGKQYPWGTSLVVDYNIFGLCLITGLLSGYYILKRQIHFTYHVAVNLMALTIFFASVFSASRRTWFVLTVLILMIAGAFLKNLMKNIFLFLSTFKLKRSEFIKKLATGITLTAIIIGIVALVPKDISIKHTYQLTRIKNRFVNIINISEINLKRGSRYNRYDFAFQHINEYSILNLLIGNGSNYLKEFGQKFNGSGYDYPHNPILSAILQSGLIGALLIVGYICYCLFLYIKNLKFEETRFYFLVTLVLSFYYFISGNSVFSSKIYIFFTLLMPFAINRIFKTTD